MLEPSISLIVFQFVEVGFQAHVALLKPALLLFVQVKTALQLIYLIHLPLNLFILLLQLLLQPSVLSLCTFLRFTGW